jgi:hypothetical protein
MDADGKEQAGLEGAEPPARPKPQIHLESPADDAVREGLTVDFRQATLDWLAHIVTRLQQRVPRAVDGEYTSSIRLSKPSLPVPRLPEEHIRGLATKESTFISEIISVPRESPSLIPPEHDQANKLRLDLPVITSNNNLDLQRHIKHVRKKLSTTLDGHSLPLQPVNVEQDEAIDLPESSKTILLVLERVGEKAQIPNNSIFRGNDCDLHGIAATFGGLDGGELCDKLLDDEYLARDPQKVAEIVA